MKILLALIIISPGFLSFIRKDFFHDRRTKKNAIISNILFVCWILAVAAMAYQVRIDQIASNKLSNDLIELRSQNNIIIAGKDSLLKVNQEISTKLSRYQTENAALKELAYNQFISSIRNFTSPNGEFIVTTPYKGLVNKYNEARRNYQSGNMLASKIILEMLLRKEPNYPDALNLYAIILNQEGDSSSAIALLEKASKISSQAMFRNNLEIIRNNPGQKMQIVNK